MHVDRDWYHQPPWITEINKKTPGHKNDRAFGLLDCRASQRSATAAGLSWLVLLMERTSTR